MRNRQLATVHVDVQNLYGSYNKVWTLNSGLPVSRLQPPFRQVLPQVFPCLTRTLMCFVANRCPSPSKHVIPHSAGQKLPTHTKMMLSDLHEHLPHAVSSGTWKFVPQKIYTRPYKQARTRAHPLRRQYKNDICQYVCSKIGGTHEVAMHTGRGVKERLFPTHLFKKGTCLLWIMQWLSWY